MLQLPRRSCSSRVLSSCLQRPYRHVRTRSVASHAQQWAPSAGSDDFGPLTDIEKIMVNSIKATGPLSFATYMQLCLSHPTHGYYMNPQHAVFGTRGDFTTSPEISQVFGELVAPSRPFRIIELGPGRGTLMDDMLRVFRQFPTSRTKLTNVHLESKLKHAVHGGSPAIVWHDALDDFFDALPVHLIEKTSHGWHEVLIALSKNQSPTGDVLHSDSRKSVPKPHACYPPTPTATSTLLGNLSPRYANLPVGSRIEVSDRVGGCALVVDYGAEHAVGNSLRAFKEHKIVDIFHRPGEFTSLGTLRQGEFLKRLGVHLRAASLIQAAPTMERKKAIEEGVSRLVDPLGMGGQYAVLGITSEKKGDQGLWPVRGR
ncbi:S-adenosyl-L-methionine-dependent methyltransferase [Pisolithus sp. B1]|nr:S-adenosyl-L-methionine-dependent methyltransferase [Pisolithus sp. B1]